MIPSSRSLLSRDKRLPLNTWNQSGVQENVFENRFSTFDSPRDLPQRDSCLLPDSLQRHREAIPHQRTVKASPTDKIMADFCVESDDYQSYNTGGITAELCGRTAKTADVGITIGQIPYSCIVLGVEDPIQNTGIQWF